LDHLIYKKAVFYVMSGTGNTYRVGCWMEEILSRYNIKTRIIMIEEADFDNDFYQSEDVLLGVLHPTHGFMPPWSMIKFLFRLPRRRGVHAMCTATRGAIKNGPLIVPGASGFATFFTALLMLVKGYSVRAIFSLDMPSNFINFHWGLHPKNVDNISGRTLVKLDRLMKRILSGRRIFFTLNNLWESLWCLLIMWLIPLFPIIYLLIARIFMAKVMFSNTRCVGCGLCARFCPNNAIVMKDAGKKKKRPYWTYHCENCMRCMGYCKKKAVEAGHSFAILLYFLTSVPLFSFSFVWLHELIHIPLLGYQQRIDLIKYIYFFPALFFSYWLFWHLICNPVVNKIFSYTTLTHYYRRYHQPETKLITWILHNKLE